MPGIPYYLRTLSLDLSSESALCSSASPFCESDICSTEYMETPPATIMEGIYKTNHALHGEDNEVPSVRCQKKHNFIQTVWNNISETLLRRPDMILSKMNNPLSVTVMNTDIINTSFFETSVEHKIQLSTDKPYNYETQEKRSLNMMGQNTCFQDLKPVDTFRPFIMDDEKFWPYYENDNDNYRLLNDEEETVENLTKNMVFNDACKDNNVMESHMRYNREIEESNDFNNFHSTDVDLKEYTDSDEEKLDDEKTVPGSVNINEDASMNAESFCIVSKSHVPSQVTTDSVEKAPISILISTVCQKVWEKMTNPFYYRPTCVDLEAEAKRLKQHQCKKTINAVATGRGRGRAKSQLRRSGVSQTSHRKQNTRFHDLDIDIENNYEVGQDAEVYHTIQSNDSLNDKPSGFNGTDGYDVTDDAQSIKMINSVTYNSPNMLFIKNKSLMLQEGKQQEATKSIQVRCTLGSSVTVDEDCLSETFSQDVPHKGFFRSRLLSESSVDSEDSFCILFETELEAENVIDCDEINSSDQDSEDDSIDTINGNDQSNEKLTMQARKVKFNPLPIVHVMVKWDYAYRAARKGPWEDMARDNERFRRRINLTATILNPILARQHRSRVWQERFACQE